MTIELRLLGPVQVLIDGRSTIDQLDRKEIALLAYLSIQQVEVSRERAADLLWGNLDLIDVKPRPNVGHALSPLSTDARPADSRAKHNLRHALYNLNRVMPGGIQAYGRHSIALNQSVRQNSDVWQFDHRLRHGDPAGAVALYRGPLLDGLDLRNADAFEEWLSERRVHYEHRVLTCLSALIADTQRRSDNAALERHARQMLAINPLKERATRALMLALGRRGHFTAALEVYSQCATTLQRELGVAPSAETMAVRERILLARAVERRVLPFQATAFIGRERELAEASARLFQPDSRLLTFVGLGGSGKTRLAIELARRNRSQLLHDVAYINLDAEACAISEEGLLRSIAGELGLSTSVEPPRRQLTEYLRPREMLVVLDNFESYVPAAAVLGAILREAPDVKMLVTSRQRLNIPEEIVYPVSGMAYPSGLGAVEQAGGVSLVSTDHAGFDPHTYDALTLFEQVVNRVNSAFALSANVDAVISLCRLVEGLPLAIELIAPWTLTEPVTAMVARLSAEMLQFIDHERNFAERHRSLHAVFEHSWQRLTPMEQEVLRRLATITGSFSLPAALAIAGATQPTLRDLADKSMLEVPETGRYALHSLLRAFALEKLQVAGELPGTREAHYHYFARFIESLLPELRGRNQLSTLQELEEEFGNIRVAWRYGIEHATADQLCSLMDGIYQFCTARTWYSLGLDISVAGKAVLARRDLSGVLGRLLINEGLMHHHLGNHDQAGHCAEEGRILCEQEGDNAGVAQALFLSSTVYYDSNQYEQAERLMIESFNLSRSMGNREALADLHLFLGHIVDYRTIYGPQGKVLNKPPRSFVFEHNWPTAEQTQGAEEAIAHFREALRLYNEIGHLFKIAWSRGAPGHPYYRLHLYDAALDCYLQAAEMFRQLNSVSNLVHCLSWAGWVLHWQGKMEEARRCFQEALSQGMSVLTVKKLLDCLQKYSVFLWKTERSHFIPLAANVLIAQHANTDGRIRMEANEWVKNIKDFMRQDEGQAAVDQAIVYGEHVTLAGLVYHLLQ